MNLPPLTAGASLRRSRARYTGEPDADWREDILPQQLPAENPYVGPYGSAGYIFTMGNIRATFPSLSLEKEFFQAAEPSDLSPDHGTQLYNVLSRIENLYIAREMCWIYQIHEVDLYVLVPATERELLDLVRALSPQAGEYYDVIVGDMGPGSNPARCNGISLPTVFISELNTYTVPDMIQSIEARTDLTQPQAKECLGHFLTLADNPGVTDEDRALNYLIFQYPNIYEQTNRLKAKSYQLSGVRAEKSDIRGAQNTYDIIFRYTGPNNTHEVYSVTVDVTRRHPYLVSGWTRYFGRL